MTRKRVTLGLSVALWATLIALMLGAGNTVGLSKNLDGAITMSLFPVLFIAFAIYWWEDKSARGASLLLSGFSLLWMASAWLTYFGII